MLPQAKEHLQREETSDCRPPELGEKKFLLAIKFVVIC